MIGEYMKILKSIAVTLAVAFSCNTLAAEDADTLVVGIEASSEPFVIVDKATNAYIGYDIDLIKEVAKEAGYKDVKFKDMPFDAMFADVLVEQVDCAISMITITEERAQIWDFIGPYFDTGLDIMVNKKFEGKVKSPQDMQGMTMCAKTSSTCEAYGMTIPGVTIMSFDSERDVFGNAIEGKCDSVITNEPIIQYFLKVNDKKDQFYRFGNKLTHAQFGIMTSKNRPEINERITKALNKVMQTPYFKSLYTKWFE